MKQTNKLKTKMKTIMKQTAKLKMKMMIYLKHIQIKVRKKIIF